MFKKLIDGELSLKDTFWKFGVLGMLVLLSPTSCTPQILV